MLAPSHRDGHVYRPAARDHLREVRLRFGADDDADALRRLAALDSAAVPESPLLVAEVEGELHAALSLGNGRTIADPFHPTAGLVELLELRARAIRTASKRSPDGASTRVGRHLWLASGPVAQ